MKQIYHIWRDQNLIRRLIKTEAKSIIVYAAEEVEISDRFDPAIINDKTVTYIFGGADIQQYKRYTDVAKVKLWKDYFLYYAAAGIDTRNTRLEPVDKLFISLNNKGHQHRCILQDLLCKHELLDLGVYSWRNVETENYNFKYWEPKVRLLDQRKQSNFQQHILPREMNTCLINVVPESTTDKVFITEKTFHPILVGKPFLTYGAPGTYKAIQKLGFKLHDNVFDYSFDNIQDDTERAEAIVQELAKIKDEDYQLVELQLCDVAKFNKEHAIKLIKNQDNIPNLARKFKYYTKVIKEAVCKLDSLASEN
jgi:hypothetical protein